MSLMFMNLSEQASLSNVAWCGGGCSCVAGPLSRSGRAAIALDWMDPGRVWIRGLRVPVRRC